MLRFIASIPTALVVTFALFALMYGLIQQPEVVDEPETREPLVIIFDREPPPPAPDEIEVPDLPELPETPRPQPPRGEGTSPVVIDTRPLPRPEPIRGDVPIGLGLQPIITVAPTYPSSCLSRGIEGSVDLVFDVTYGGEVVNARVVSATDSCFERSALTAVRRWKYQPSLSSSADPNEIRARGLRRTITFTIDD